MPPVETGTLVVLDAPCVNDMSRLKKAVAGALGDACTTPMRLLACALVMLEKAVMSPVKALAGSLGDDRTTFMRLSACVCVRGAAKETEGTKTRRAARGRTSLFIASGVSLLKPYSWAGSAARRSSAKAYIAWYSNVVSAQKNKRASREALLFFAPAPRVGFEPTTNRLHFIFSFPKRVDYIFIPVKCNCRMRGASDSFEPYSLSG